MKAFISLFYILLLTSCTSIPLSSLLKMASFDRDAISAISPKDVRVRLSVTEPVTLQAKDIKLALKFDHYDGSHSEYQFQLEMMDAQKIQPTLNWFSAKKAKNSYQLKLSQLSQLDFNKYQKEHYQQGKPKRYYWTVYYYLKNKPKNNNTLKIDLELKLSNEDDYFYLLKDAPISIN